jgi:mitogen-activated protein kinase 1/3
MEDIFKNQPSGAKDPFADWDVGTDYKCIRRLGKGGYGEVCEALHKPTGKRVAIKRMDSVFCSRTHARRILREIVLLRRLKHSYVVDILDIIQPADPKTFDEVYIVLELADMDMRKLIESDTFLTL